MAKQTINIGASPNDGTGTPLRTAFDYTNQNFTELYTATGPSGNNIVVPGNATITGDLTVDTSTLKVDSTNDRVGIGTVSPAAGAKLGVTGATVVSTSDYIGSSTWAARFTGSSNGASSGISFFTNSSSGFPTPASIHATPIADYRSALVATYSADSSGAGYFAVNRSSPIGGNTLEHYKIDNTGVATWSNVGGVAGTAMTLNSTGLGVGASPGLSGGSRRALTVNASTGQLSILELAVNGSIAGYLFSNASQTTLSSQGSTFFSVETNAAERLRVDASGNLLVGTTGASSLIGGSGAITAKGLAGTLSVNVTALATDYTLPIGAFSGIITIRSNGGGGSAVFMLDPNVGAVSIANNIVGRTITLTFSSGSWKLQQTAGTVSSLYNYLVLSTQ